MKRTALTAALLGAIAVVFVVGLTIGSAGLSVAEVAEALVGRGDSRSTQIIVQWRLPRVLFAAVGGAALGLSGAIFQFLTRNPLGSPDIIGFSAGSYTGALLVAASGYSSLWAGPLGALIGGLSTGAIVYFLAWDRGMGSLKIIVVGIAVGLFMSAINTYLILTLDRSRAILAAGWGVGNLADIGWRHTIILLAVVLAVIPVIWFLGPQMRLLELGDDTARSLGLRVGAARTEMMLVGIVLVAVVTAAAGPIAFVALAAPQLAKRLSRSFAIPLVLTATVGALLMLTSDIFARWVIPGGQLPVGVVTLCVGGLYLLWLLSSTAGFQTSGSAS